MKTKVEFNFDQLNNKIDAHTAKIEEYLNQEIEKLIASGMDPVAAKAVAIEKCREHFSMSAPDEEK